MDIFTKKEGDSNISDNFKNKQINKEIGNHVIKGSVFKPVRYVGSGAKKNPYKLLIIIAVIVGALILISGLGYYFISVSGNKSSGNFSNDTIDNNFSVEVMNNSGNGRTEINGSQVSPVNKSTFGDTTSTGTSTGGGGTLPPSSDPVCENDVDCLFVGTFCDSNTPFTCNAGIDGCLDKQNLQPCLANEICQAGTGCVQMPCTQDSECVSFSGDCSIGFCNQSSEICEANYSSSQDLCRLSDNNGCDVPDYCTGTSSECPENFKQSGTLCTDNGLFCDGVEVCNGQGTCINPGHSCSDGIACTTDDVCNEETDSCINTPSDAECLIISPQCESATCDINQGCINFSLPGCETPINLSRGPYLQPTEDMETSVGVAWDTYENETTTIYYGFNDVNENSSVSVNKKRHYFKLINLTQGTIYKYKIVDSSGKSTPIYEFKTSPLDGNFKMIVGSDWHFGGENQEDRFNNAYPDILEFDPDVLFITGDFIDFGNEIEDYEDFFNIAKELLATAIFIPVPGNHEFSYDNHERYPEYNPNEGDMLGYYVEQFYLPENGPSNKKERSYSVDYGGIHFVILDYYINETWLDSDLSNSSIDSETNFILVGKHHPLYLDTQSDREITLSTEKLKSSLLFDKYGVDIEFVGHRHMYQRSFPILNNPYDPLQWGIVQTNEKEYYNNNVNGTIYQQSRSMWYSKNPGYSNLYFANSGEEKRLGYSEINLHGKQLSLESYSYNSEGNNRLIEDKYIINKSDNSENPKPIISNIRVSELGTFRVTIEWDSDILNRGQIEFGTSKGVYEYVDMRADQFQVFKTAHKSYLQNLNKGTTYYFRIRSFNFGYETISQEYNFTTNSDSQPGEIVSEFDFGPLIYVPEGIRVSSVSAPYFGGPLGYDNKTRHGFYAKIPPENSWDFYSWNNYVQYNFPNNISHKNGSNTFCAISNENRYRSTWKTEIQNGEYDIELTVGNAHPYWFGDTKINVEDGQLIFEAPMPLNHFDLWTWTGRVNITDGFLDIEPGFGNSDHEKFTVISKLKIYSKDSLANPCVNDIGCTNKGSFCDIDQPYECSFESDGCYDRTNLSRCFTNQTCEIDNGCVQNKINSIIVGDIEVDPSTLHSIGISLPIENGDDNYNAKVNVYYRKQSSEIWSKALDLLRVRPETLFGSSESPFTINEQFAGSIFNLEPQTSYEIILELIDLDGGNINKTSTITTRSLPLENPENSNEINVSNIDDLNNAIVNSQAGDIIVLSKGVYEGPINIRNSGTALNPIFIRGENKEEVIINNKGNIGGDVFTYVITITGSNIVIENLSILAYEKSGISVRNSNTLIRNLIIKNISYGIWATGGSSNMFYNNVFEGMNALDSEIGYRDGEGIVIAGSGHDIFYNNFSGLGDAMSITHQSTVPSRAIDFYDNIIFHGGDDGIELDYGERNIRAYRNKISNVLKGISFQPIYGGPVYAFRNKIFNTHSSPFKHNNNPSGIYIMHNSAVRPGFAWQQADGQNKISNLKFYNNLIVGEDYGISNYRTVSVSNEIVFGEIDYNAYYPDGLFIYYETTWNNFSEVKKYSPFDNNSILLTDLIFKNPIILPLVDTRQIIDVDMSLNSDSNAIDTGIIIFNINDDFTGNSPDIGAYEFDFVGVQSFGTQNVILSEESSSGLLPWIVIVNFFKKLFGMK
ncbi:hypothetical protein GOV12_01635 [Candidatus Pacearchaeota archaeon]|nr:hypothetical protein [Candidatus Pacearchaeota archaeon]